MKCSDPYPEGSYEECQLDLGHAGQHEYVGTTWARLQPKALDPDVASLLEETKPPRTWGVDERKYPVVVTETITRVIWVAAESEDEALGYWEDDYADLDLKDADVIDGSLEFERPDEFQRQEAAEHRHHRQKIGPQIACPGCGELAFRREWFHDPYRKCHGPIEWREYFRGPRREFKATPVFDATGQAVAA